MAEFLNEHEQVEALKDFWKRYGKLLITIIVLIIVAMAGWRYWQNREAAQRQVASESYQSMLMNIQAKQYNDAKAQAYALMQSHPGNAYGALSALLLAKINVEQKQYVQAEQNLRWVIKHSNTATFIDVAKLRLARILISQKHAEQALVALGKAPGSYPALYYQVQGEAYQANQQPDKARAAFNLALAVMAKTDPLHDYLTMQKNNV